MVLRTVRERGSGLRESLRPREPRQRRGEGDVSQGDHHPDTGECLPLRVQVFLARLDLGGRRLVVGRRTAHSRSDVGVPQSQPVVDALGHGMAGEARRVHRPHQEIA